MSEIKLKSLLRISATICFVSNHLERNFYLYYWNFEMQISIQPHDSRWNCGYGRCSFPQTVIFGCTYLEKWENLNFAKKCRKFDDKVCNKVNNKMAGENSTRYLLLSLWAGKRSGQNKKWRKKINFARTRVNFFDGNCKRVKLCDHTYPKIGRISYWLAASRSSKYCWLPMDKSNYIGLKVDQGHCD